MSHLTMRDYEQAAENARTSFEESSVGSQPSVKETWLTLVDMFTRRAHNDGVNIDYFKETLNEAQKVLQEFCSITQPVFEGESNRPLWRHQKVNRFGDLDPATDANLKELKELTSTYASTPMIHSDFLDWVFVDSLLFAEIKAFTRAMMITQFGAAPGNPAYFLSKGDEAKYRILKPVFAILGIVVNYITPAVVGYFFLQSGHEVFGLILITIALAGAVSFVGLHSRREERKAHNMRLLEKTIEMYGELKDGVLHRDGLRNLIDEATNLRMKVDRAILSIVRRDA